ncbi:MAG: radical SAM family heme chaperone HemW [Bacteroidia bacterium]|nr:radical SAM family heme chaperone HemW [Bacteroidia bacterium]
MAGIYFHIPFCKQKCSYCDFYSRKDSNGLEELVKFEIKELVSRKDYLNKELIETIYFGGGTPSLLSIDNISELLNCTKQNFVISNECEITFEANPDDLDEEYLKCLYSLEINRLSIGIQSFNDSILKFLGRRHNSKKLQYIIETAQNIGFTNISVDLIFGIPGMELSTYLESLNRVIKLNVQHISAYSLTISKGTLFYKMLKNNKLNEINEEDLINQFNKTIDLLSDNGFLHYEISNYAKEGFKSRHNCSYWENVKYLGIGPSAHSYNLVSRQWNISDTKKYCSNIDQLKCFYEVEFLTNNDHFNEYIITGLRNSNGVSKKYIIENFDEKISCHFMKKIKNLYNDNLIYFNSDKIVLTRKGILISDYILGLLYCV